MTSEPVPEPTSPPADPAGSDRARALRPPADAAEAEALQRELAPLVERADRLGEVRLVAGVDVGYAVSGDALCAGIAVLDAATLEVVETVVHEDVARFPYVPGLFSFRELPPLLAAFEALERRPDLVVCDGQGIAHPRRFGLACHLGLALDLPAIGCAKSLYVGEAGEPGAARGAHAPIVHGGETVGAALRMQDGVRPVYVSVGHRVSLGTAIARTLALGPRYRQPETTRAADSLVRAALKRRAGR